jgi:NAD(P)-dependent dehydrogenase (short-subunit alcohol dehydrogenase family)
MHINKLFNLDNRSAVIIGGGGKVGFPMSEALAEAGAKVYIASRSNKNYQPAVDKLSKSGLNAMGIQLDQSNEESVREALQIIKSDFKTPDILINASSYRPMTKFYEDSYTNWDNSMAINSRGLFISCRLFGNEMAKEKKGSIINISSIYGVVAPDFRIYEGVDFQTEPDYPFIKGGIISYSRYLASFYSKANVRVNCILPGGVFNNQPEKFIKNYSKKVLIKGLANTNDLKGAALFFASDASRYVTGSTLTIDGGLTSI